MVTLARERVAVVLQDLCIGGAQTQAMLLGEQLQARGALVTFWGLGTDGPVSDWCRDRSILCRQTPVNLNQRRGPKVAQLLHFARELRRARPSAILPYCMTPNVACGLLWRTTGAQACVWNQREPGSQRVGHRTERVAIRRVTRVVCNARHLAGFLSDEYGVRIQDVSVVPNAVVLGTPANPTSAWRSRLNAEDRLCVAMMGNFTASKDQATLLRAWRLVLDSRASRPGKEPLLILAGRFDGGELPLKALAYDLCLGDRVAFLDAVADVSGLLAVVDIGVHSSNAEGCSNAVLELMAAAKPIVASDIPGMQDTIGAVNRRWLVRPGAIDEWAAAITSLLDDRRIRAQLGQRNRVWVATEYSPDAMYAGMVSALFGERPDRSPHVLARTVERDERRMGCAPRYGSGSDGNTGGLVE